MCYAMCEKAEECSFELIDMCVYVFSGAFTVVLFSLPKVNNGFQS